MINFHDIEIDYSQLKFIEQEAKKHEGFNPGCSLIKYWSERMPTKMIAKLKESKRLPYGYVGDGWPIKSDQSKAIEYDKRQLRNFYKSFHNRDCGDAVYQSNILMDILNINDKNQPLDIIDIGAGYGRLAIPFLYYCNNIRYYAIDNVPLSLLIAPQFIKSIFYKMKSFYVYDLNHIITNLNKPDKVFYSMPVWNIDYLKHITYDLYISIHSFQEMTIEAVKFYIDFMHRQTIDFTKSTKSYFYSVNIDSEEINNKEYIPKTWEKIFDRGFPINRDGHYNERLWLIK